MTNTETASLLAEFHGAFPNVYVDEAVAEVWANALALTDFGPAREAAAHWVQTMTRFPTIAEFNGEVRRIETRGNENELPEGKAPPDVGAAKAAFQEGYRKAKRLAGENPEDSDYKLNGYLRDWPHVGPNVKTMQ